MLNAEKLIGVRGRGARACAAGLDEVLEMALENPEWDKEVVTGRVVVIPSPH